ncbi:MAG: hypothetical protein IJV31_09080 [Clostridia bacterium]|nr:hypothetical protein [Clostridia bacterium]
MDIIQIGKEIPDSDQITILKEQLKYERNELKRLKKARTTNNTLRGPYGRSERSPKIHKIVNLNTKIKELEKKINKDSMERY